MIIFSFGAVSRGAIYALEAHGFRDITICIQRPDHAVREEVLDCHYVRIQKGEKGEARMLVVEHDGSQRPLTELIGEAGIIINGTYQDPGSPLDFITEDETACLRPDSLIIDVSCDEGMGFHFARPTTFKDPMFKVGRATITRSITRQVTCGKVPRAPSRPHSSSACPRWPKDALGGRATQPWPMR